MNKNWKTMALPVIGVVALVVGNLMGLDQAQIDSLKGAMGDAITVVATVVSLYGIWKSHDKKQK